MTPAERVAHALALGARSLEIYATANGLDAHEARRRIERARQAGRRRSACIEALLS